MGAPPELDGFIQNPRVKLMMTGATPIVGTPHFVLGCLGVWIWGLNQQILRVPLQLDLKQLERWDELAPATIADG